MSLEFQTIQTRCHFKLTALLDIIVVEINLKKRELLICVSEIVPKPGTVAVFQSKRFAVLGKLIVDT